MFVLAKLSAISKPPLEKDGFPVITLEKVEALPRTVCQDEARARVSPTVVATV